MSIESILELIRAEMGKTYTRGQILLELPKDEVFDAVIKWCKENNWDIGYTSKTEYLIGAKVPFSWLKNEFASTVWIYLTDDKQYGSNTLLDIYNDYPTPKPGIIRRFFEILAQNIPLTMNYSEDIERLVAEVEVFKFVLFLVCRNERIGQAHSI